MSDASDDLVVPLREHPVIGVEARDGAVIIRLAGELDLHNVGDVRAALTEAIEREPRCVVIDLEAVEFVDSTALGVLIEARSRLANRRGFLLAAPGLEAKRALEISGLDRHFSVHDSVDDALAAEL